MRARRAGSHLASGFARRLIHGGANILILPLIAATPTADAVHPQNYNLNEQSDDLSGLTIRTSGPAHERCLVRALQWPHSFHSRGAPDASLTINLPAELTTMRFHPPLPVPLPEHLLARRQVFSWRLINHQFGLCARTEWQLFDAPDTLISGNSHSLNYRLRRPSINDNISSMEVYTLSLSQWQK